jgi:hypothetical protein
MHARALFAALLSVFTFECGAQSADDPNHRLPNSILTADRGGYSISALVTHDEGATRFTRGVVLFPGSPGIIRLREEGGQLRYDQAGNFLVRSRRHWLDGETLLLTVDAPTDQWNFFNQRFRATPRYGDDVRALLEEAGRRYAVSDWTLVGTSEGSITAFHAARMNPNLAKRVILTSSVFTATPSGPGLSGERLDDLNAPLLWVHHADDPCKYTQYRDAQRYAERTMSPLVTVRGGSEPRGDACAARTQHGYIGVERDTVLAMRAWLLTGKVPADVSR